MSHNPTNVGKLNAGGCAGGRPEDICRQNLRRGESGQAMLEYILLVAMIAFALIGTIGLFMGALGTFYLNIVKIITLPFP